MQFQLNKLLLAAAILVIAGVVTPLFVLKPWKQPSQEMTLLRRLEQQLQLPQSTARMEDDAGLHKDKEGTTHTTRQITNFYDTSGPVKQAQEQMRTKGWALRTTINADGKASVIMINLVDRACAELRTSAMPGEQESDGPTNRVVLMAESDDACSGYLAF